MAPRIELVCIGTELLNGKVNTHASAIGQKLFGLGLSLAFEHTVGDDEHLMKETFAAALKRSDVVISAGGLGPTFDDITREVWSTVTKRKLSRQKYLVDEIEDKFKRRGLKMPPHNKRQGDVLKTARVIPNANGTAPGQFLEMGDKWLFLLPGPGRELFPMMDSFVLPQLRTRYSKLSSRQKTFLMVGVPESKIDALVRPLVNRFQTINQCAVIHGILASQSVVSVKFRVEGADPNLVEKSCNHLTKKFRACLSPYMFGEDDDSLPIVAGRLLKSRGETLAVAESCTGGLIGKLITDIPGSSDYFLEGVITYSNISKQNRLGVRPTSLKKWGAVSAQVAQEMASGLQKKTKADWALSVTGIAGPTLDGSNKPAGLVYIGCAGPKGVNVKKFEFNGDREWVRHRAALMALDILRRNLCRDTANIS